MLFFIFVFNRAIHQLVASLRKELTTANKQYCCAKHASSSYLCERRVATIPSAHIPFQSIANERPAGDNW